MLIVETIHKVQPRPKLGACVQWLDGELRQDQQLVKRQQRTAKILYVQLQDQGNAGG